MKFRPSLFRDELNVIKKREQKEKEELLGLLFDCMEQVDGELQDRIKHQIIKLK